MGPLEKGPLELLENWKISTPERPGAGGGKGIRTPDIQLAKLALYQLSYTPFQLGEELSGLAPWLQAWQCTPSNTGLVWGVSRTSYFVSLFPLEGLFVKGSHAELPELQEAKTDLCLARLAAGIDF